jgi:hypothetical protein
MAVIIGDTDRPGEVNEVFERIFRDFRMPKSIDVRPVESIFHTFDVINRKTGKAMRMTQIGPDRQSAADTIYNHNLKGIDWETERFLAPVSTPDEEAAAMELRKVYPQIHKTKEEIEYNEKCFEEAPGRNKSDYLEMKFSDGQSDLEAQLARLETRREELEGMLSNW